MSFRLFLQGFSHADLQPKPPPAKAFRRFNISSLSLKRIALSITISGLSPVPTAFTSGKISDGTFIPLTPSPDVGPYDIGHSCATPSSPSMAAKWEI